MNNIILSKKLVEIRTELLNSPAYKDLLKAHSLIDSLLAEIQEESLNDKAEKKNPHSD